MLGVAPPFQGRGVGTRLIRALHERIDADPAPSYLETDRRENVAFYRRTSYTVLSEERVAGVPVWRMWRESPSR
jgi:ribosomal protein S18 acetylase RimI-like enzyme